MRTQAGEITTIDDAIAAVEGARLDWARNDKVYAALGVALRSLRLTREKARVEKRKVYTEGSQGK